MSFHSEVTWASTYTLKKNNAIKLITQFITLGSKISLGSGFIPFPREDFFSDAECQTNKCIVCSIKTRYIKYFFLYETRDKVVFGEGILGLYRPQTGCITYCLEVGEEATASF